MKNKIVTRFPPSPTGWFHVGNARTALFNYFYTKKNGGELKFRLEDTDKERSKQEYSDDIISGLKWLGIDIDYSKPYKQSEHSETYKKYLEKMISEDKAYLSKEEVKEEIEKEPARSPVEIAVRENIIKLVNMRAGKIVKSDDRAEWVKKITDEDMITKFKVGQITVDGKKKKAKDEIVKAIIADMRGENE